MTVLQTIFRAVYAIWALGAAVASALMVGTTLLLPFIVIPRGKRERFTILGAQLWARLVVQGILLTRVEVEGRFPEEVRGALLVCNHQSWLDPLLLIGWTRSNGLSKKLVWYIPFVGIYGWLSGAVYFDRRDKADRARARDEVHHLIRGGHRIQLFPEGTRSVDGILREKIYLTLVKDAYDAGIPVVPCAVDRSSAVLPVGELAAVPLQRVGLWIGEALRPEAFADREAFADAAWGAVKRRVAMSRASAQSGD